MSTQPNDPAGQPPEAQRPKRRRWPWLLLALVLAAAIAGTALYLTLDRSKPSAPVLRCESTQAELTNGQFQFYFWDAYYNLLDTYGSSIGSYLDTSRPLDEQQYDDSRTWQDYVQELALQQAQDAFRLTQAAQAAGFTLPEAQQQELDGLQATVEQAAQEAGKDGIDAYLIARYGPDADFASYQSYTAARRTADAYSQALYKEKQYTPEEIESYYDQRAEEYEMNYGVAKSGDRRMDIRVIYFYPDSTDSKDDWAAAKKRAGDVRTEWEKDPTDEHFAQLADARTESAVAPEGGLISGVVPQSQPAALDEWLYGGETRAAGDCTALQCDDSWLLVYVKAVDEQPYWQEVAEADLRYEDYTAALEQLKADYVLTTYPEHIVIQEPEGLHEPSAVPDNVEAVG